MNNLQLWIGFVAAIVILLAIDLGVFQRKAHSLNVREAALWTAVWCSLAVCFGVGVFYHMGKKAGLEFFTGYLIEYSLSVDNVFLFAVIFQYFKVPLSYQRRVLYWGILSAVAMRGVMIAAGSHLIESFSWLNYLFGAFLIFTGIKMFRQRDEETDPGNSFVVRVFRNRLPFVDRYEGQNFLIKENGKYYATLLLLVLALIEITDVLFALDSIPAIFGITDDAFIIFTSNILAVLGLRSLYFLLAGVMDMFHYLSVGLSFILGFVGAKMILEHAHWLEIAPGYSLLVILGILTIAVVASLRHPKPEGEAQAHEEIPEEAQEETNAQA